MTMTMVSMTTMTMSATAITAMPTAGCTVTLMS
jgi:hypothetical protein